MSIINRMLQELDRRHAAQTPASIPGSDPEGLTKPLRPVEAGGLGSRRFWQWMAGVMAVIVAWAAWVMWRITPRSVVTDVVQQSMNRPVPMPPPPNAAPAANATPGVEVAGSDAAPAARAEPPVAAAKRSRRSASAAEAPGVDRLRLATGIARPTAEHPARQTRSEGSKNQDTAASSGPDAKPAEIATAASARAVKAPVRPGEPAPRAVNSSRQAGAEDASGPSGHIDKREIEGGRERADAAFRDAMGLVNQGRIAEGMDGLHEALTSDPTYEPARQTLVSLLFESRRFDDAAAALREGLGINPANAGFAMSLARIYVDRGNLTGALALLQQHGAAGRSVAEYRAFAAALYQRLGRHGEAMDEYLEALKLSGGNGAWWVGLGISQEASGRSREAVESFRRARASGNLNPDLVVFVDQRLKQLQ